MVNRNRGRASRRRRAALGALALAAGLWSAGSAEAQAGRPTLYAGRCQMGYCSWFTIDRRDFVGSNATGFLYKAVTHGWQTKAPAGQDQPTLDGPGAESVSYVFCSKAKPAVMFPDAGQTTAPIVPLAPGWPDGVSGATEFAYNFYFAVCHGIVPTTDEQWNSLVRQFGYPSTPIDLDTSRTGTPRDLLDR